MVLKRYRKPFVWIVSIALVLLAGAGGCAKATPTPEPVMISFAFSNSDTEYYQRILQKFNEVYPYITVNLQPRRGDMLGGIGPGNADVFISSQFAQAWLKEQGNILDLTPLTEQDKAFSLSDFYPGTLGLYSSKGQIWGIPAGVDLMVIYYNQDLFDQYGVEYPRTGWTWNDFLSTAMMLRDPEANVFGYTPNYGAFDALVFIYQHGGRIFDDLQTPTRTTFDDPLTIEALEWYASLIYDTNVSPTPEQMREAFSSNSDPRIGVQLGHIGMWSGLLSERNSTWMKDLRVGMVPMPVDKQAATMTLIEGYFVSSQTQHIDACWKWISFLSQQFPERTIPVRESLLESDEYETKAGSILANIARISMRDALLLSSELAQFEEALNVFNQAYEAIMAGTSSPQEAMTRAQQESKLK
ncbi:MAG: sugar ABC transporter substrate-binding protein [Anaerolineae bacterium]|nr:sugar ABC transporter substrate-binding protein [Anaerolineae bacterium]